MKTIIVPTDFSAGSVNAAIYATQLAGQLQAHIMLLHALPLPVTAAELPFPPTGYNNALAETDQLMRELKEKLERNSPVSISYQVTIESFLSEIERLNQRNDIFAMVMGMSDAGDAEAFLLGSFNLMAATHLKHPLIIVPEGCSFNGYQKLGLGCDMLNVSETLPGKSILAFFEYFNAKLHVLHIAKPGTEVTAQVAVATRSIQNILQQLQPEIHLATHNTVKEGLEHFVQLNDIDLLIITPKERSFVEKLFHKSVTKSMALHSKVPVMILHKEA